MITILVVEDNIDIRKMLAMMLKKSNFNVEYAMDASSAWSKLTSQLDISIVILDWMLPDKSGISLLKKIRKDTYLKDKPVIMLTARAEEENILKAFDSGVDDYVTKPFSTKQLKARINAILKRLNLIDELLIYHDLVLNLVKKELLIKQNKIKLSRLEFNLLKLFLLKKGKVLSRQDILYKICGYNHNNTERTVDVHIRRIRKILKEFDYDKYLISVHGEGYKWLDYNEEPNN